MGTEMPGSVPQVENTMTNKQEYNISFTKKENFVHWES
jgi:hypothetical protein